jgi:hypothetical protein
MELAEIVRLRPGLCAGLLLTLTRRCPLACAHCSTASTMAGEEPDAGDLLRFVDSFTGADRPELVFLTGGEPLLLPGLVEDLAVAARRAGTRSVVLTGAYFARQGRAPRRIMRAIEAVDHFSVSLDAFHEREIPRADVFALLRRVLDMGIAVSVHAVGSGPDDPYLADLTAHTRRVFADRVPLLVNTVRKVGRAASWNNASPVTGPVASRPLPCAMAAWPTVAFDGTVVACCNQATVDRRPVPAHLRLGHIRVDRWADVRARALASPVLRMVRVVGPTQLAARFAPAPDAARTVAELEDAGYCGGCRRLSERPELVEAVGRVAAGPAGALLDRYAAQRQVAAGPVALLRRHGCAPYAHLVALTQRADHRQEPS